MTAPFGSAMAPDCAGAPGLGEDPPTAADDRAGAFGSAARAGPDHRERVQSVRRACAVLRVLSTGPVPCSTQVIAERAKLDRTVVRRLLRTLEPEGLVSQSQQRWQLGPAAASLGSAYVDAHNLHKIVLHHAVVLHDDVCVGRPWVVNAAVPIGAEAVVIARLLGPAAPVDSVLKAGTRLPIAGSALGRAMLAFLDVETRREIVGVEAAERFAERGQLIRDRGGIDIAVDELRPGISAMAAAVLGDGDAVAALGVSGPTARMPLSASSDLADRLRRSASRVAEEHRATSPRWWPGLSTDTAAAP